MYSTLMKQDNYFSSIEWRCFGRGAKPEALLANFLVSGARREPDRTDTYFVFPHAQTVGVKLREGMLEIKAFVREGPLVQMGAYGQAPLEYWEKSSWSDPILVERAARLWERRVHKMRQVTKKRWIHTLQAPSGDASEPSCCQLELAELSVSGKAFWTIGVEGYPAKPETEDLVREVFQRKFPEWKRLFPEESNVVLASYPGWLQALSIRK